MKKDNWLIIAIVLLTSTTTVLTLWDGTFLGFLRGVGFAAVLDGSILYWENKSEKLPDSRQRSWANGMKWAAVGMLVAILVAYVLTLFVPVDAMENVNIFGMQFVSTLQEAIHWTVYGVISFWVVLTLGVVLYLREIDPETKRERERNKAQIEAVKQQQDKEDEAYKTAMEAVAELTGVEKGLKEFENRLKEAGYTEFERQQMLAIAKNKLIAQKTGAVPVDTSELFINKFGSTVKDETTNFTPPPTPKI